MLKDSSICFVRSISHYTCQGIGFQMHKKSGVNKCICLDCLKDFDGISVPVLFLIFGFGGRKEVIEWMTELSGTVQNKSVIKVH